MVGPHQRRRFEKRFEKFLGRESPAACVRIKGESEASYLNLPTLGKVRKREGKASGCQKCDFNPPRILQG